MHQYMQYAERARHARLSLSIGERDLTALLPTTHTKDYKYCVVTTQPRICVVRNVLLLLLSRLCGNGGAFGRIPTRAQVSSFSAMPKSLKSASPTVGAVRSPAWPTHDSRLHQCIKHPQQHLMVYANRMVQEGPERHSCVLVGVLQHPRA